MDDRIPDQTLSSVRANYLATLRDLPPPLGDFGCRLLRQLDSPQWTLEWALPYWLASALALAPEISTHLVLCNALGLSYIRLEDDLADGEIPEPDRLPALLLAHHFYQTTVLNYLELFDHRSPFWRYFKLWLEDWVSGTLGFDASKPLPLSAYDDRDYLALAQRGAPLKIGCAAACLLADRTDALDPLAGALDHALVAMVLLDHLDDWDRDLQASRYNAFVASASDLPQTPAHRATNRARVLEMLYLGDRGASYMERIRERLKLAGDAQLPVKLDQFSRHLGTLATRATAYHDDLAQRHRAVLGKAAETLFGPCVPVGAPAITAKGGPLRQ
ncbi:MAG: hypothetical protein IT331_05355 [Anaerolineae bacterium]|nr:hypothetical protein [Anaerolineae bacterium]